MIINLHATLAHSMVNGPGTRYVVWFQGCPFGCPGCFNPGTHDPAGGYTTSVEMVVSEILSHQAGIEGVTISGGEPFEQPEALLELLTLLRARTELSVVLFSGNTLEQIHNLPIGADVLRLVDILVDGRYVQSQHLGRGLRGSENQRVHFLSDRYGISDLQSVPTSEVVISPDGVITISGLDPL